MRDFIISFIYVFQIRALSKKFTFADLVQNCLTIQKYVWLVCQTSSGLANIYQSLQGSTERLVLLRSIWQIEHANISFPVVPSQI